MPVEGKKLTWPAGEGGSKEDLYRSSLLQKKGLTSSVYLLRELLQARGVDLQVASVGGRV